MKHLLTFRGWLKGKRESFATFAMQKIKSLKNLKSLMPIFVGNEVRESRVMVGKVPTNYQLISNLSPTVTRYFIYHSVDANEMVRFFLSGIDTGFFRLLYRFEKITPIRITQQRAQATRTPAFNIVYSCRFLLESLEQFFNIFAFHLYYLLFA